MARWAQAQPCPQERNDSELQRRKKLPETPCMMPIKPQKRNSSMPRSRSRLQSDAAQEQECALAVARSCRRVRLPTRERLGLLRALFGAASEQKEFGENWRFCMVQRSTIAGRRCLGSLACRLLAPRFLIEGREEALCGAACPANHPRATNCCAACKTARCGAVGGRCAQCEH